MIDSKLTTVGFYNLENLFDTVRDPHVLDADFTPEGDNHWTEERYENKVYKLGKAISEIGFEETSQAPALIGVAEVENKKVLQDLVDSEELKAYDYDFVHYNSPDERGIDNALLYCKKVFEVVDSKPITVLVTNPDGQRDYTRDILYVCGRLHGQLVHLYVNHWPSRREGDEATSYKRVIAAQTLLRHLDEVRAQQENAQVMIMGDFNDDPSSKSIQELLQSGFLYNPMQKLHNPEDTGSLTYRGRWNLFDQILVSTNFMDPSSKLSFEKAAILSERFLEDWNKRYEGFPFRTYAGPKYVGGYSDHFPVYVLLAMG